MDAGDNPAGDGQAPILGVDRVREELVRLGYLRSGVDRYFLDDLGAGRSRFRRAARGAVRGALLLSLPLAISASATILAWNPSPSARPLDGAVVAAVLLPLAFLAALAILLLIGSVASIAFTGSRRRPDPSLLARGISVSLAVGGAAFAVVVSGAAAGGALVATSRAAVFAAMGLAAERIVYDELLALFVALEGIAPRGKRTGTLTIGILAAAVVATAAGVSALAGSRGEAPEAPSPLVVRQRPGRVVVVAVDGYDDETMRHFAADGSLVRLPALALGPATFRYRRLAASPPEVWTTLWTGVSASRHGMRAYEWVRPAGCGRVLRELGGVGWWFRDVLVAARLASIGAATATERTAAALWEITGRAGYPTLQVGNWGSGPATSLLGRSVSNRAPLRLRRGESAAGEVAPAELLPRLVASAASVPKASSDAEWLDEWERRLFLEFWDEKRETFGVVYFSGLDLIRNPVGEKRSEKDLVVRAEALRRSYLALDRFLDRLSTGPDAPAVVMVGDPGRSSDVESSGVVYFDRFGLERGAAAARPVDLLPTILAWLGIPLSKELEGGVLGAPLPATSRVARYERPSTSTATSAVRPDPEEYLRELRSLGYIR